MKKYLVACVAIFASLLSCCHDQRVSNDININSTLILECRKGNIQGVENCLRQKADINTMDQNGFTPLMVASDLGHDKVVRCDQP